MEGNAEITELTQIKKEDIDAEMNQQGETNMGFDLQTNNDEQKKEDEPKWELPPLTYIDFLPQCFGTRMAGGDPVYATFQTVVEQANQWLMTSPQFSVVKCETVDYKLTRLTPDDLSLTPDLCLQHFSSHGRNLYVRGLRLWLMPRTDQSLPIQQLGYVTVLPDHTSGNLMEALSAIKPAAMRSAPEQVFKEFDTMKVTMEKLNHRLQQKPVPGRILTVETLNFKAVEADCKLDFDTEQTFWAESGKGVRLFLFVTRIFYVVGPPAFETLCYNDAEPDTLQDPDGFGLRVKFAPFSQTVAKTAAWLTRQTNMRAVNFQSVTLKMERPGGVGPFKTNPEAAGYTESQVLQECRYVKVLRLFYVKDPQQQKAGSGVAPTPSPPPPPPPTLPTTPLLPHQPSPPASPQSSSSPPLPPSSSSSLPSAPALYKSVQLTTRLFVPTRGSGSRDFETFSKTMERVIMWLKATGTPVLGMETVRYSIHPETDQGVVSERVDSVVSTFSGQYSLACIRLYFPCQFQEPPPEVVPETQEDSWGWACVVS